MVTRFCTFKIHFCLRNRNFLNHLRAVQDGNKDLLPKLQSPQNLFSSLKVGSAMRQSMSVIQAQVLCSALPSSGFCFTGRTLAPFRNSTFGREKPGWAAGLCEHWERVWGLVSKLRSTSDVKPSPSSHSGWSKHPENSLLQLCKLSLLNCSTRTAPHSYSIATVSLAIFRGK